LEKFIQEHLPGDGTPEVCLATGAPAAQILHTAHLIQADVILLGTHTEGKPEARLLGDTVARVVREALCPVTIVPPTWACVERAQDQGAEAG
jgi:nucleotide-binding universal stress UspA family protein